MLHQPAETWKIHVISYVCEHTLGHQFLHVNGPRIALRKDRPETTSGMFPRGEKAMNTAKGNRSSGRKKESGATAAPQSTGPHSSQEKTGRADIPPDASYFTDRFVPYLINHAASLFNLQFRKDLRKLDISVMQWRALAVLHGEPGLALREIVAKTAIDQPTLSRVVDQLHERGLIERAARESDSRYLSLSLTASGEDLYQNLWQLAWKHYQRGTSHLTPEETETLMMLLKKTISSLEAN
ncbi:MULTISPECIES: MarR family winged helix-turn-helix transcriptional regulator [Burkholderiaceae]|uniref:MarR family winged helix-turn-helix transcriptional regulator n=2 Tax=Burkholderiales TaxID=80840 RepID=UPI001423C9EC|nr:MULTISPECIES: MarR family winged helix-turn-helix transcriptional regulator [Burkholderiaceae]MBN3846613.1 winged helix-turn-helix transcriptional regulator [Paraburkholderia sp. Ac-20342]